jgi:hypothetical protein
MYLWRSSTRSSITVNSRLQVIVPDPCPWKTEHQFHILALKLEFTGFSVEDIIAVRFNPILRVARDILGYRTAWNFFCLWLRKS